MKKRIAIGCDHAGFPYKESIVGLLRSKGMEVLDFGTHSAESVDYPDFAHPVAEEVESGDTAMGVVMCGSGNGIAMTVNKHQGVRAAICWNEELARLARQHNDANVLSIPVRFVSEETALAMVEAFLNTEFEGGRHARRVGKISLDSH
ncbi:MAG: ribose 5-phosphate isomerase B [Lewinellaceae bacterium]|nr:ribose 5-phosphate isomerase B [Lewinellaceae bacterium]